MSARTRRPFVPVRQLESPNSQLSRAVTSLNGTPQNLQLAAEAITRGATNLYPAAIMAINGGDQKIGYLQVIIENSSLQNDLSVISNLLDIAQQFPSNTSFYTQNYLQRLFNEAQHSAAQFYNAKLARSLGYARNFSVAPN